MSDIRGEALGYRFIEGVAKEWLATGVNRCGGAVEIRSGDGQDRVYWRQPDTDILGSFLPPHTLCLRILCHVLRTKRTVD